MSNISYSLAELCICAAAEAWRNDGEVLATGITPVPRLAAGLARLTINRDLMMTDGEAYLVEEPVALGPRDGAAPIIEGWMTYSRVFDVLWSGKRHAMVVPTQLDRFGQTNISVIGDYARPKVALLGVRGFPGNTASHANSFFIPGHGTRAFVKGEVDMVGGIGYNPERWPGGTKPRGLDLRLIVTDLAVLDFGGPKHQIRVRSLHPGVSFDEVQQKTGFELLREKEIPVTAAPTEAQLACIRERLDPKNVRATVFKGNPPGTRSA